MVPAALSPLLMEVPSPLMLALTLLRWLLLAVVWGDFKGKALFFAPPSEVDLPALAAWSEVRSRLHIRHL